MLEQGLNCSGAQAEHYVNSYGEDHPVSVAFSKCPPESKHYSRLNKTLSSIFFALQAHRHSFN